MLEAGSVHATPHELQINEECHWYLAMCSFVVVVVCVRVGWGVHVLDCMAHRHIRFSLSQHHLPLQGETDCLLQRCADIEYHNIPSYSPCLILLWWTQQHAATHIFLLIYHFGAIMWGGCCLKKFSRQNKPAGSHSCQLVHLSKN